MNTIYSTVDIIKGLKKLDKLFSSKSKWTKGMIARNKYSKECSVTNPKAVRFCLMGGCQKVAIGWGDILASELITEKLPVLSDFNDNKNTKFEDIKKLIKETIERLENTP